jgi:tRNA pseudouridine38-40 synthase
MRRLESVCVERSGALVTIEVTANAFLQHMVRNMVGVLAEIARGRPYQWAAQVLGRRDRRYGAITAPAAGLSLVAVYYPRSFDLPEPELDHAGSGPGV